MQVFHIKVLILLNVNMLKIFTTYAKNFKKLGHVSTYTQHIQLCHSGILSTKFAPAIRYVVVDDDDDDDDDDD